MYETLRSWPAALMWRPKTQPPPFFPLQFQAEDDVCFAASQGGLSGSSSPRVRAGTSKRQRSHTRHPPLGQPQLNVPRISAAGQLRKVSYIRTSLTILIQFDSSFIFCTRTDGERERPFSHHSSEPQGYRHLKTGVCPYLSRQILREVSVLASESFTVKKGI